MLTSGIRRFGLVAGPGLAFVTYWLLPDHYRNASGELLVFSHAGHATGSLLVWMAVWWMTEAIDLAATALLPIAILPLVGAASIRAAAAPYGSDLIFLFMGGFILALSMQRWGLDKRIALMALRLAGTRPVNMIGGCMLATAVIGGFVSNTAMAAMMLPIGLSVIAMVRERGQADGSDSTSHANFATCMVLGIAYASTLSGVTTLIGTPPNTFLAAFIRDQIDHPYRQEITFMKWMLIGVPLMIVFLPIVWLLLTRVLFPVRLAPIVGGRTLINQMREELGPMNRGQWVTFIVFCTTALGWIGRQWLVKFQIGTGSNATHPLAGLTDSGIAILGALMLFLIPAGRRSSEGFVMDWHTAAKLPWGILVLFGGGLSLAAAIQANGVAEFLGSQARHLTGMPEIVLIFVVTAAVVLFSEVASNTATATTIVPILAALAPGLGVHPFLLIFPATLAASFAFMMPVGTPPNALAFGTGFVSMRQMLRAGFVFNLIGMLLVVLVTLMVVRPLYISAS